MMQEYKITMGQKRDKKEPVPNCPKGQKRTGTKLPKGTKKNRYQIYLVKQKKDKKEPAPNYQIKKIRKN